MSVALVHDFDTEVGTVDNVGPGVDDTALRVDNRLVKVGSVEVEGHGGDTHGSEPDSNNGPGGKEKVKCTRVVEGSVLEDQASKVSVSGHNVVCLFFSSSVVSRIKRRSDQGDVHGGNEQSTKDSGDSSHMKRVEENIVFGLEDQHEIEGSANTKLSQSEKTKASADAMERTLPRHFDVQLKGIPSEKDPCPIG